MYVYLQTKFQVYSLIITSFRQGGSFNLSATPYHGPQIEKASWVARG